MGKVVGAPSRTAGGMSLDGAGEEVVTGSATWNKQTTEYYHNNSRGRNLAARWRCTS